MKIHYLQHVPFENMAYIDKWIQTNSHSSSCSALYNNEPLPAQSDFDCLVIMGGPMGVHDEKEYPWMLDEKKFIEQTIKENKTVIGICLGAQLIANVLGANVFKGQYKEIGWFPVTKTANNTILDSIWPEEFYAFHWHSDTFDIPRGAIHTIESPACKNQGFIYQQNVFAFQFHLESTQQSIEQLILNCGYELKEKAPYIQDDNTIRNLSRYTVHCNRYMRHFLDYIIGPEQQL